MCRPRRVRLARHDLESRYSARGLRDRRAPREGPPRISPDAGWRKATMDDGDDRLLYLAAGPLAAIFLGMLLVPLRDVTSASNFTFVFMALTIAIAALGGRPAAVATALCSALSLDFFLTKPYLRLTIDEKHDAIAFVGLAVCGLIAATLGPERGERSALRAARAHLQLLHVTVSQLEAAGPLETHLTKVLGGLR